MAYDTSPLSAENVLRDIHDPSTQTIRTSATAIIAPGLEIEIDHTSDSVAIGTATDLFTATTVGPKVGLDVNVINSSTALPANAATETTLAAVLTELQGKTEPSDAQNIRAIDSGTDSISVPGVAQESTLSSIDTKIVTTAFGIKVDGSAVVQPVSQSGSWTVALPADAATNTSQIAGNNILTSIDNKIPTLGQHPASGSISVILSSDQVLNVDLNGFSATPDSVLSVGSIDGTASGTKYGIVNNLRQQVLDSHDRQADFTYVDFGTKNQRIVRIDYSSATFPSSTVRREFTYTLVGNNYRRDDEIWTIV